MLYSTITGTPYCWTLSNPGTGAYNRRQKQETRAHVPVTMQTWWHWMQHCPLTISNAIVSIAKHTCVQLCTRHINWEAVTVAAATCGEVKVHRSLELWLRSKSGSDRLLQLTSLVGGANLDQINDDDEISLSINERQKNRIKMAECDDDRSHWYNWINEWQ